MKEICTLYNVHSTFHQYTCTVIMYIGKLCRIFASLGKVLKNVSQNSDHVGVKASANVIRPFSTAKIVILAVNLSSW